MCLVEEILFSYFLFYFEEAPAPGAGVPPGADGPPAANEDFVDAERVRKARVFFNAS